jgi:hypothetical protein
MSLLSQLMRPEDFVKLDEPTAARLEAAASQLVVTDTSKPGLQKQLEDLHRSIPKP